MGAVAVILILLIIIAVILAVLGVFIWMIFLVYRAGGAVPAEHQRMDPGMVWLMVIPVFQTIWAFFVASRICGGLSAAFEARGLDRGDCGRFKGMAYAVSMVLQLVLSIVGGGLQLVGSLRMSNMSTGTESPPLDPWMIAGVSASAFGGIVALVGLVFLILFVVEVNRRGKELGSLATAPIDVGNHPRTE